MPPAVLGCQGCGRCLQVCSTGALITEGGKVVRVDASKCLECYKCVEVCPYGALIKMD